MPATTVAEVKIPITLARRSEESFAKVVDDSREKTRFDNPQQETQRVKLRGQHRINMCGGRGESPSERAAEDRLPRADLGQQKVAGQGENRVAYKKNIPAPRPYATSLNPRSPFICSCREPDVGPVHVVQDVTDEQQGNKPQRDFSVEIVICSSDGCESR